MNQALNEMIDTFEKMNIISNEQKVHKLIQQNQAMIFFIRQQNSHNLILAAVMHDKIERIQQIMNGVCEKSTSSVKKINKKKTTRKSQLNRML